MLQSKTVFSYLIAKLWHERPVRHIRATVVRHIRNGMVGDTFRGSNNPATSRLWCNKDRIVSWYYVTSLANQSLLTVIKFYVEKKKRSGVQATLYFTEVGGR